MQSIMDKYPNLSLPRRRLCLRRDPETGKKCDVFPCRHEACHDPDWLEDNEEQSAGYKEDIQRWDEELGNFEEELTYSEEEPEECDGKETKDYDKLWMCFKHREHPESVMEKYGISSDDWERSNLAS